MNVFYEEAGTFKVGAVLLDNNSSLQVEAIHGKRSKIKAASVLFQFETHSLLEYRILQYQSGGRILRPRTNAD